MVDDCFKNMFVVTLCFSPQLLTIKTCQASRTYKDSSVLWYYMAYNAALHRPGCRCQHFRGPFCLHVRGSPRIFCLKTVSVVGTALNTWSLTKLNLFLHPAAKRPLSVSQLLKIHDPLLTWNKDLICVNEHPPALLEIMVCYMAQTDSFWSMASPYVW